MSQTEVERLLGRLITDREFREKAAASLVRVCYSEGFTLSDEELRLLKAMDFSGFSLLSETLEDSIRRT